MSYANGTLNYNLPQTVGTDKRDWSDTNQAFSDVDAALKAASDAASQAAEDITSLTTRVGTAEDDILALKGEDISLDGRLDTAEGAISTLQLQVPDVRADLEDMISAFNEATATSTHEYPAGDYFIYNNVLYQATTSIGIGDTIVPNTNCRATNITTELLNGAAAPAAADVSLAPITGMTADDVQEGIAELKSALGISFSVTADGVKKYSDLIAELVTLSSGYTLNGKSVLYVDGIAFSKSLHSSNNAFTAIEWAGSNTVTVRSIRFTATPNYGSTEIASGSVVSTALQDNIPTNGSVLTLYI